MKLPMFAGIAASLITGSCSTAPAEQTSSPAASTRLADALNGRVAGPPQRCISNYPTAEMRVIDDFTILYTEGGRSTVYVQNPRGGCPGLSNGMRTLVSRQVGTSQMCDGDINEMVDLSSRMSGGACVFGPFVPYTRPR